MADIGVDIKIGVEGTEQKQLYRNIDISVELHQEKLTKISQDLCSILSKTSLPFIVIEYPQGHQENEEIFNFKEKDYESTFHIHSGKLYQFANPRNKETVKLIKNLQKQFQKVTKLNNSFTLKLSLYDPFNAEERKEPLSMLNGCKIKGHSQTDQELIFTLVEIIRRISNQFLNSPVMAFAELLEQFSFKAELEKIEEFPKDLKMSMAQALNFKQWILRQNLPSLAQSKGDIIININLPKLLSVKLRSDAATFAAMASTFA